MTLFILIKRNIKLFFKDKGLFFTSLVTPIILLVLYATFLSNIYRNSFISNIPTGININNKLIDSFVASQLISSILAVSCVTVSFSTNLLMVSDIANETIKDLKIAPIKSHTLAISYFIATLISTLIINIVAISFSLIYLSTVGFYMSFIDAILLFLDVFLLTLFGTSLSSVVNVFLKTEGQISAVGAIVSAGYGFVCGAYMPIASFSNGLQSVIMFIPGTYGTSLIREHVMGGIFRQLGSEGMPDLAIQSLRKAFDCDIYFFDNLVSTAIKYLVLIVSIVILLLVYILINYLKNRKK